MGKRKKEIDWEQAAKLAELHLDAEQVAYALGVSYYHLLKEIKAKFGYDWKQFREIHRTNAKIEILRRQFKLARNGNVHMLKWLGINWCGQSDKQTVEVDIGINMLSADEIAERIVSALTKYPEIEAQILNKLPDDGQVLNQIPDNGCDREKEAINTGETEVSGQG